jgi:competence protein ComEC
MALTSGVLICLAYIFGLGLFSAGVSWAGYAILGLGVFATAVKPKIGMQSPKRIWWLLAGSIGLFATFYLQVRTPQLTEANIGQYVQPQNELQSDLVTVQGEVLATPRLTRSDKLRFVLQSTQLSSVTNGDREPTIESVRGKVYVTVPLLQGTGMHPGQTVQVTGFLYQPQPASNPGGFDFQSYLAKQGIFAGLAGRHVQFIDETPKPGLWQLRQRIIHTQVESLGVPQGTLMSSIVLGRRAVDLPYDIRDSFIQAGMAHVLAASGFHVSLILGMVLVMTRRLDVKARFAIGSLVLLLYIGLTGASASVLRASLMGIAALFALVVKRKVKPTGALLVAATLLLLVNPLWIEDLGFQMSFLATLGLIVTVPALLKKLDWLPPAIASLFAIPLAAFLWVLPIQLYVFGTVASYSILTNTVTSLAVGGITLGGAIDAVAALFYPPAGNFLAQLLHYPIQWLIQIVEFFNSLPGNRVAVGTIAVWQVILLYGIFGWVWLEPWWHRSRRWLLALFLILAIVALPAWQRSTQLFQATILANTSEPILVIQNRGNTVLMNSGDRDTAEYTVIPFLQKQGIDTLDYAIATGEQFYKSRGWLPILQEFQIESFYGPPSLADSVNRIDGKIQPVQANQRLDLGSIQLQTPSQEFPAWQWQIGKRRWLMLANADRQDWQRLQENNQIKNQLQDVDVLWWSGNRLLPDFLDTIQPEIAIASTNSIHPDTRTLLYERGIKTYYTGRDGALRWTPQQGWQKLVESVESHEFQL